MQKSFSGNAPVGVLTALLTGTPTTFQTDVASGFPTGTPGPFVIVIDRTLTNEEKILCTSLSGTTFTIQNRGWDGTVRTDHQQGAKVEHVIDADTIQEANSHVNDDTRDDHSQYYNQGRHDAHVHPVGTIPQLGRATIDPTLTPFIGQVVMSAKSAADAGWLLCDGTAYARTGTYANLFAAIGTTYGVGDGTSTFNVPDMRGAFPIMGASNVPTGRVTHALGSTGGEETHTLTTNETPSHFHTPTDSATMSPGPSNFVTGPNATQAPGVSSHLVGDAGTAKVGNFNYNTPQTSSVGGGAAHNNLPPYLAINFVIKST